MPPAMDDSLEKLQAFCGLLADTNSALEEDKLALQKRLDDFERLDNDASDQLPDLEEDLDDLRVTQDEAAQDALDAVDELGGRARQIAETDLRARAGEVDELRDTMTDRLTQERDDLEQSAAPVRDQRLPALADELETAEEGCTTADQRNAAAFTALGEVVERLEEQAEAPRAQTTRSLTEAADGAEGEAQAMETESAEDASAWSDEVPAAVLQVSPAAAETLAGLYEGWNDDAKAEGAELMSALAGKLREAVEVAQQATTELGQTLRALADGPLDSFADEVQVDADVLTLAEPVADQLEPMAADLKIVQGVVAEIDRLLTAVE